MPQEKPVRQKSHGMLFFTAAFIAIVIITFVFRRPGISWLEDYQAGLQKSAKLNKPMLVCFYWETGPFSAAMQRGTWRDRRVVAFVHKNFVPVLLSLDDHPELAAEYKADYDGACFIRLPDGTRSGQATHGNRPPSEYIERIQAKLAEITSNRP
ncbi:MAG TPA: thioredoxin family protein [Sedimentisphaerales bacterium]|nr:thioredoxin family protein [Sedimentisphaerales bacterium]